MSLSGPAALYDLIHGLWDRPATSRRIACVLIFTFLIAGGCVLLNKTGMLPESLSRFLPTNPFFAIQLAFSMILAVEAAELIFAIADSLSHAVAKQMEIMALILLRESFTDIGLLHSTISIANDGPLLLQVAATAIAGLLLFLFRGIFFKLYKSRPFNDNIHTYVEAKKCIALFLLLVFVVAGAHDLYLIGFTENKPVFFKVFYSALIFTDIFLVLVSQYFMPCFHATFRNSGYAMGTLIMRIALGSPHALGAGLCVFAGLYLLALTWATSRYLPPEQQR